MNTILILLLILVAIIGIYITYRYMYPDKNKVTGKMYLGNGAPGEKPTVIIPMSNLDKPSSKAFCFEFWLNVNKYPSVSFSNYSTIYGYKSITNDSPNGIIMCTDDNSMSFDLFQEGILAFYYGNSNSNGTLPSVYIENVPLKKWIYIIVSVNNCFVDLYVDGKLNKSMNQTKKNPNCGDLKISETNNLVFGNKVDAYIAGMNRYAYKMDTNMAWTSYMQKKMFMSKSDYSIHLDLFKNNKLNKKITVYS